MADSWLYMHDGRTHGPVSTEEIKDRARKGELLAQDLVWAEGTPQDRAVPAMAALDFSSLACEKAVPDWLADVDDTNRRGPMPAPQAPAAVPEWLEEMRLWFAFELSSPGEASSTPPGGEPTPSATSATSDRKISGLVEAWKLEILEPTAPAGPGRSTPPAPTARPAESVPTRPAAPPPPKPPLPIPTSASPAPVNAPAQQKKQAPPAGPKPSPPELPSLQAEELLTRKTRQEAGVDLVTGRIVEPEKFQKWKQENSAIDLLTQPRPPAAAKQRLSNASVFEIFRQGRLEVDAWVDDDLNLQLVKFASMEDIYADADLRRLFARYQGHPKAIQEKLRQHLEFMVRNRRKYYEATGDKQGW